MLISNLLAKRAKEIFFVEPNHLTRRSPGTPSSSLFETIMAVIESTSSSAKSVRKESSVARIVGSGSAGVLELALFHPVVICSWTSG